MRIAAGIAVLLLSAAAAHGQDGTHPWPLYNKGVRWQKSLEEAQAAAKKERKLVLYYLNTGDVDKDETS